MTSAQTQAMPSPAAAPTKRGRFLVWAVAFVALSLLDFALTWRLLEGPGAQCYEANPLAAAVLDHAGWWGLGAYKMACAGIVLAVVAFVARRRPRLARGLLKVGCPVLAVVVGYSGYLLAADPTALSDLERAEERGRMLTQRFREQQSYAATLRQLSGEVAAGRASLRRATRTLAAEIGQLHHFDPLPALRIIHNGPGDNACLTAQLVRTAGMVLHDSATGPKLLRRFEREFRRLYHCPLPESARETHSPEYDRDDPDVVPVGDEDRPQT